MYLQPSTQPVATAGQRTWSSTRSFIFKQKIPESTTFPTGIRCSNSSTPYLGRITSTNTEISIITPQLVLTEIWGIIGTSGASFLCALLQDSMPGKAPQLQPWELSCTATASFSSNFKPCSQTQRCDLQSRASTGSCRYFVSFKQRDRDSAATSLDYSWMPTTEKLGAFPFDR